MMHTMESFKMRRNKRHHHTVKDSRPKVTVHSERFFMRTILQFHSPIPYFNLRPDFITVLLQNNIKPRPNVQALLDKHFEFFLSSMPVRLATTTSTFCLSI